MANEAEEAWTVCFRVLITFVPILIPPGHSFTAEAAGPGLGRPDVSAAHLH